MTTLTSFDPVNSAIYSIYRPPDSDDIWQSGSIIRAAGPLDTGKGESPVEGYHTINGTKPDKGTEENTFLYIGSFLRFGYSFRVYESATKAAIIVDPNKEQPTDSKPDFVVDYHRQAVELIHFKPPWAYYVKGKLQASPSEDSSEKQEPLKGVHKSDGISSPDKKDDPDFYKYQGAYKVGDHRFNVWGTENTEKDVIITSDNAPANSPGWLENLDDIKARLSSNLPPPCFMAGTEIATPAGICLVEDLKTGDPILTASGKVIAVKWIGRRSYYPRLSRDPRIEPVCIRAGALGNGLPHSDLTVTADHGMILDDMVIHASALVNGSDIAFVPLADLPDRVTYYHVETEAREVILANGAAAGTFVDVLTRAAFDNYAEYLNLYGVDRMIPEMDRLRVTAHRLLTAQARQQLGIAAPATATETPEVPETPEPAE